MNWIALTEECCGTQGCSLSAIPKTTLTTTSRRVAQGVLKKRENISRVALAVQKAYEANPAGTREQTQEQATKFIVSSFIFFFIGSLLLNKVMSIALTWFLDYLFRPEKNE